MTTPPSLPRISLSPATIAALEEAASRRVSYRVRCLLTPDQRRVLVVLGEAHMKLGAAHRLGERIVAGFGLRGVETFPRTAFLGRLLRLLIHGPRLALRAATLGWIKGSTITSTVELETGTTVKLEDEQNVPLALHVASLYVSGFFLLAFSAMFASLLGIVAMPLTVALGIMQAHFFLTALPAYALRAHAWHWCLNPGVAILTTRNVTMAEGTVRMLADHPTHPAAVVVVGRAHVSGYGDLLIDRYRYVELDPALLPRMI